MRLFGLDIGTTSVSGVCLDAADGLNPPDDGVETESARITAAISRDHGADLPASQEWEATQDPERIWKCTRDVLAGLAAEAGEPDAIGLCSQMHGVVYVDASGNAVSPLYSWLDGRGNLPVETGGPTYAEVVREASGLPAATGYGAVTTLYHVRSGTLPADAARLATIGDYVALRLIGATEPQIEASQAHGIGMFDPEHLGWDIEGMRACGLDPALFPEVVAPGSIIGHLAPTAGLADAGGKSKADSAGLAERNEESEAASSMTRGTAGRPVMVCIGDNQASFLGTVRDPGRVGAVSLGTSGQISCYLPNYRELPGLSVRPFPDGGYIAVGASLLGGKAYTILKDFFREICEAICAAESAESSGPRRAAHTGEVPHPAADGDTGARDDATLYRAMNRLAREAFNAAATGAGGEGPAGAGPNRPRVTTTFLGTRDDPKRRGAVTNITAGNLTVGNLALGFLEGVVDELGEFFERMPAGIRGSVTGLAGTGNLIRRNPLVRTLVERRVGVAVSLPAYREEAAVGAALHAGVGIGAFRDYAEAASAVRYE